MRLLALLPAAALLVASAPASATPWDFTYEGHLLAGAIVGTTTLTVPEAFTLTARFDDTSPNLAAPIGVPGFVAYAPTRATLTLGGQRYSVKSWDGTSGIAVSIFDGTTPFADVPGHYGAGFIQNVLADGAGIVGDWITSTPDFSAAHLTPFRMTRADFWGVGYNPGTCATNCLQPGETYNVQPVEATLNGVSTPITFLPGGDVNVPSNGIPPSTPFRDYAALSSVPEPAALALLGLGFGAISMGRRRTR